MEGDEPDEEEDPMKGWVMVRGKACQEETETEEKSTPEEERWKEIFKYPYLTWFLRTQVVSEEWDLELIRRSGRRREEYEDSLKKVERDNKGRVEEWLVREGVGSSEVDRILS